jgi:hypothetical protein
VFRMPNRYSLEEIMRYLTLTLTEASEKAKSQ